MKGILDQLTRIRSWLRKNGPIASMRKSSIAKVRRFISWELGDKQSILTETSHTGESFHPPEIAGAVQIQLATWGGGFLVLFCSADDRYTLDNPQNVAPKNLSVDLINGAIRHTLPAWSQTVPRIPRLEACGRVFIRLFPNDKKCAECLCPL